MSYTLVKDLGMKSYTNSKGNTVRAHLGYFKCDNCGFIRKMPVHQAPTYDKCITCSQCSKRLMAPGEKEKKEKMRAVWRAMKSRCYNPNNDHYKYYGSKGITICDRWLNSFDNFYIDNKDKYAIGLSIDRIDNNKGYYPSNVQWIPYGINSVKDKLKPVLQYEVSYIDVHLLSANKEPLHRYNSITEAANATNINVKHIAEVCAGHRHTAGGYYWRYDDGKVNKVRTLLTKTARPINQYLIDKLSGEITFIKRWETAYQAEEALKGEGVNHTNIAKVCSGKRKSCGGYYWEYAEA